MVLATLTSATLLLFSSWKMFFSNLQISEPCLQILGLKNFAKALVHSSWENNVFSEVWKTGIIAQILTVYISNDQWQEDIHPGPPLPCDQVKCRQRHPNDAGRTGCPSLMARSQNTWTRLHSCILKTGSAYTDHSLWP